MRGKEGAGLYRPLLIASIALLGLTMCFARCRTSRLSDWLTSSSKVGFRNARTRLKGYSYTNKKIRNAAPDEA
jgi:hypothetical protein